VKVQLDEFELIRRFFLRQESGAGVLIGIGDDGAVITPAADRSLVVVVDSLVEGVHYPLNFPAEHVGYRALAVNLSDVAAMAGTPRWMTLALTLPEAREEWLTNFAAGLFEAAREYDVSLIGGDTTRGEQTVISVQLLGEVVSTAVLTRAGAGAGDGIYVSGTVGDAAAGLALLQTSRRAGSADDVAYLQARFARPCARVNLGLAIGGVATAAIDLSDGLGADLVKLLQASAVAGTIDLHRLPLSPQLLRTFDDELALGYALDGGDDYELCFTAKASDQSRIEELASRHNLPLTRIGEVSPGTGLTCLKGGQRISWQGRGYSHF
jgi:thiamine-monophosphate kinase